MSDEVTNNARARKQRVFYSEEIVSEILDRISSGESMNKICSIDGMPTRKAFLAWVGDNPSLKDQYEVAMIMRSDVLAEEILEIADDGRNDTYQTENGEGVNHDVIARSRLRVDARKWLASKMAPKKYGDKVEHEHKGGVTLTVSTDDAGIL